MPITSLRVLVRISWPDAASTVSRFWDGSGPYLDEDGEIWAGAGLLTGIDAIEQAINGEASTLNISLSGISAGTADRAWQEYQDGDVIGATLDILLQPCGSDDQPAGAALEMFSGRVDNILFDDAGSQPSAGGGSSGGSADGNSSSVTIQVTNRFNFRRLLNGASLSDADQRARSAVLNPEGTPDRFAERVPLMQNKTLVWPRFS